MADTPHPPPAAALDAALNAARANQARYLDDLKRYLAFPSVSAQPDRAPDTRRAATWLRDHLRGIGLRAELMETGAPSSPGHPVVFAEWRHPDPARPTLLVYGHYDVQPAEPLDEWITPPFEPAIRDDAIYARGASDDKGQHLAHVKAVESALQAAGGLPVSVKFLIEGEEEIGGPHLGAFIASQADLLACDAVVISDTSLLSPAQPTLIYGLRGLVFFEVEARCAARDLHSGSYGGNVQNPLMALARILAQMKDGQGRVTAPGFYDDVRRLDPGERELLAGAPMTEAGLLAETGALCAFGEPEYSIAERAGARPTFEINGLWGGYTGPGAKTVLPAVARAKISCRLVPRQDPQRVQQAVIAHMRRLAPAGTTLTFHSLQDGAPGSLIDRNSPHIQAAARAAQAAYGNAPVWMLEGGSLPVVRDFQEVLGKPVILLGFGLPDDGIHGPNERLSLECYAKGVEASIRLLFEL
jgi:acetylornithine deacetylase/succinyl-diaminopimelate desuccinylase-like protein